MLNSHISDLFFNLDHGDYVLEDQKTGEFRAWDEAKLLEQATWFCDCMKHGCGIILSATDVVADFLKRV